MPNGRSGFFSLKRLEFERLLARFEGDVVVGKGSEDALVNASALVQTLREWERDTVVVEEQYHEWYLIHFQPMVKVDEGSPLFELFRRADAEFWREYAERKNAESGSHGNT